MEWFVGVEEARANLGRLTDDAAAGEEVWLTKRGRPLAVLLGLEEYDRLRAAATRAERAELAKRLAAARRRVKKAGLTRASSMTLWLPRGSRPDAHSRRYQHIGLRIRVERRARRGRGRDTRWATDVAQQRAAAELDRVLRYPKLVAIFPDAARILVLLSAIAEAVAPHYRIDAVASSVGPLGDQGSLSKSVPGSS